MEVLKLKNWHYLKYKGHFYFCVQRCSSGVYGRFWKFQEVSQSCEGWFTCGYMWSTDANATSDRIRCVLSSLKHNISCYYFDFKTCTDVKMYCSDWCRNISAFYQLSFMLCELVFLWCHSQFASYPYTFASYSYSCKILQPYVAATVRMHCDVVLSSTGALLVKTVIENNRQ